VRGRSAGVSHRGRPGRGLAGVSKEFAPGAVTTIAGPSGSGKSTLLRILACITRAERGRVRVEDVDVVRLSGSRAAHLGSLLRELALIVGVGWFIGSGLAEGGVGAVYRLLDTYPQIPPKPVFIFDGAVVGALAGACAVLVVVAAGLAQVLGDRADAARTMRAI
jgi:ABC transporter